MQQAPSAKNKNGETRHENAPNQASNLLDSLQSTHDFLLVRVGQNSDFGSARNDARKMLQHPEGSRIGARHHEATQQSRLAKFRME